MATTGVLTAKGLHVDENQLSSVPAGAMQVANDVTLERNGLWESRPGISRLLNALANSNASQLYMYQGYLIAWRANGTLARSNGGAWTDYSGTYSAPDSSIPVRFAEASGNLYFTTNVGLYRLDSPTGTPVKAGGLKSPDITTGSLTGASGFMAGPCAVAYRVVVGFEDANGNLHLSAPSGRFVLSHTFSTNRDASITLALPDGLTTSHFVQVYRSAIVAGTTSEPSDELGLVYEKTLTSADIVALSLTVADIITDANRGAALYTNPSQEGILQANESPPLAWEVAAFQGGLVYARTTTRRRLVLSLLAVDGATGMHHLDTLTIAGQTYTATNEFATPAGSNPFLFMDTVTGTVAQQLAYTGHSLVNAINGNASNTTVQAYYLSGANEAPGKILIEEVGVGGASMTAVAAAPTLNTAAPHLSRAGTTVTVTQSTAGFFWKVGTVFDLQPVSTPDANFPAGLKTVVTVGAGTLTYTEAGAAGASTQPYTVKSANPGTPYNPPLSGAVSFDVEAKKNRLYFPKAGQPEAVPLLNYQDVGSQHAGILRELQLRNALCIFKDGDGLWRATGGGFPYNVEGVDTTLQLIAPETAVAFGGRIWALTNQGVVAIGDGVEVMSKPIEPVLRDLMSQASAALRTYAFALGDDAARQYVLFLPANSASTSATQAYVYNLAEGGWTRQTVGGTCGLVGTDGNRYLGTTGVGVSIRRQSRTANDCADYKQSVNIAVVQSGISLQLSSTSGLAVGDIIEQGTQTNGVGTRISRITVINSPVITVSPTQSWTGGAALILQAIPVEVRYHPQTAGDAVATKQFSEATFHLEGAAPTALTASFASDVSPTPETQALDVANATNPARLSTWVPAEKQRCSQLLVGLTHATALEKLSVQGFSLTYREYAKRAGK